MRTNPAGVVDDAEVGLIFELAGPLKLGMCALLLDQLVHEGLVCGLREPALLIQQRQNSWRVRLKEQSNLLDAFLAFCL